MTPDPARLEALLAETAWVRALARRLCSDSATAEDLVQDTWLAALRHRPDDRASPRAWLGKVLVNLHLARRRSEANRGARGRSAAREESLPSSSDVVERVQSSRALVEHVLELEEPYRSAVLARFFDGLSAEEIARREGLPSSTIRTRIQRGIEKLRARLQREKGADWLAALVPIARLESSTSTLGTGITGGLVMAAGAKIAFVLCAAGISTWLLWPRVQPSPLALEPPEQSSLATQDKVEPLPAPPTERRQAGAAPATAQAVEAQPLRLAPASSAPGAIQGIVIALAGANEVPVEGSEVGLWSSSPTSSTPADPFADLRADPNASPEASTRSRPNGTFEFANLRPGNYCVRARRGNSPWRGVRTKVPDAGSGPAVRIEFGESRVHGHVYDESGAPLADFPLLITGGGARGCEVTAETSTAGDGAFSFADLASGQYTGFLTHNLFGPWPARSWAIELADGDDLELDVGRPGPAAHWRGTIRCSNGDPAGGPFVLRFQRQQRSAKGSLVTTIRHLQLGDEPHFDAILDSANWVPTAGIGRRIEQGISWDEVAIDRVDVEHDLVLRGARVSGRILDSITQQPLAGYSGKLELSIHKAGSAPGTAFFSRDVEVYENSTYAIDMLGTGSWELISSPLLIGASGNKLEFTIGPGETRKQVDVLVRRP